MQLASLEHTRVRTVREIFASSGCESAGALRFLASKCTAGNVTLIPKVQKLLVLKFEYTKIHLIYSIYLNTIFSLLPMMLSMDFF